MQRDQDDGICYNTEYVMLLFNIAILQSMAICGLHGYGAMLRCYTWIHGQLGERCRPAVWPVHCEALGGGKR